MVILGAGIAGISAAYHASRLGRKAVIYEASAGWGGLLDHFTIHNFRFDRAVHLSFTEHPYVRSIFDQTDYIRHKPVSYNYEKGVWLKHPVQNNLYPLPIEDKIEAIKSFVERPKQTGFSNYRDWLIGQYGHYIAERFPVKYTRKYWTVPPEDLSVDWIGNRMHRPQLDEVLLGAMTSDTMSAYYAKEMRYPKQGGFKAFLNPMAVQCKIRTRKRAMRIHARNKYVEFTDGEKVYYEHLISSIPLPNLIAMVDPVPTEVKEAAKQLWATSVALVSIGFNRPDIPKHLWFYIYDDDIFPSRVYSPSLKSPDNVPDGYSSLQFEIYFSRHHPLKMSKDQVIEHVLDAVRKMNIAEKSDILFADYRVIPFGNVVFDHGMIARREAVKKFLRQIDIEPIGRFGEWDYLWTDQSLLSGKGAVERIVRGRCNP